MARFPDAEKRMFENVWVCMKCKATNKGRAGVKPARCRKCKGKNMRVKRKSKKA